MTGCPLHDIPEHLLYKITGSLDLTSQRNLFLSSSQLYSKWKLHVPEEDRHWQFVKRSVLLMSNMTPEDSRALANVHLHFETQRGWVSVTYQKHKQSLQFRLAQVMSRLPVMTNMTSYSNLTQAQLWHRLAASPKLAFAGFALESPFDATSVQLKKFAKQCFDMLCTAKGFLTFYMSGLEESHDELEPGYHALKVLHMGQDKWDIDGESCIVSPPQLDFDNMPLYVVRIQAHLVSEGPPEQDYLPPDDPEAYFFPDSDVIHDFAYKGNVDIDAWIEEQHEVANDWYEHMDEFMQDEDDQDDMDDLDDAAMAQLLGAMQG